MKNTELGVIKDLRAVQDQLIQALGSDAPISRALLAEAVQALNEVADRIRSDFDERYY